MEKNSNFLGITQVIRAELSAKSCSADVHSYMLLTGPPCKRKGKSGIALLTFP